VGELLRDTIRHEQTTEQALAAWDAFTQAIPDKLTSAHAYLATARAHAFTCLDLDLRARLTRLGGPELGTRVLERVMRELNARTEIGGSRWSIASLRDLLTVHTARLLRHPAWKEIKRVTHRPSTIPFRLQSSTLDGATEFVTLAIKYRCYGCTPSPHFQEPRWWDGSISY
jgi:hypothetical protein